MPKYEAIRCPCSDQSCTSWLVTDVADVRGVHFTEKQAKAVADLLNKRPIKIHDGGCRIFDSFSDHPCSCGSTKGRIEVIVEISA
jgi:hypothetical protein